MRDITLGQVAGSQLAEVMEDLQCEQALVCGRRAVARTELALAEEIARIKKSIRRERINFASLEVQAAQARYDLTSLEIEKTWRENYRVYESSERGDAS